MTVIKKHVIVIHCQMRQVFLVFMMTTTVVRAVVAGTAAPRTRVCVIGAGAGGLIAAKVMREAGLSVEVYEQASFVGGVWGRKGAVVYEGLRCNLPHQLMAFRDMPFTEAESKHKSFARTRDVGEYLERIGKDVFPRLETRVLEVRRGDRWFVRTTGGEEVFDYVVVANGHYEKPADLEFENQNAFPGRVAHSRDYDTPDEFVGKTVICVGARSSGTDIAKELVFDGNAERVVVADKGCEARAEFFGGRLVRSPPIARLRGDGGVEFADGTTEQNVDAILLCNGFDYDFPFLGDDLVEANGRAVWPLFLHMFHAEEPSLVFLGIPHSIVPFPLMQIQALLATRVFSGLVDLPPLDERRAAVARHRASLRREKDAHHMGDLQFPYCKELLDLAKLDDPADLRRWHAFIDTNREIYHHVGRRRPPIPGSPDLYRDLEYVVDHDAGRWACVNERDVDAAISRLFGTDLRFQLPATTAGSRGMRGNLEQRAPQLLFSSSSSSSSSSIG
ncbi:hypothetical protein CTAYLR_010420 [Chrysophaeum taylorii]|uniref:Flavin-containing monooxygenase n=1 Tax=Chrysophaeum taylorii TaxID=2483200 RepID=A0AAD7UH70_9STRA|nr:hypothetical protein CTAYLR_010420 [Chrysophaeum taylorii]